ncbi:hypothetical protein HN51_017596 [Arachis hypogaea]
MILVFTYIYLYFFFEKFFLLTFRYLQLNYLKHFLGGGFIKHMQENEFLHDVFNLTPKKRYLGGNEPRMSSGEKRMFKSPNSVQNNAKTQLLDKQ